MHVLKENLNQLKDFNSQGRLFFISSECVLIIPEVNQSSEDFFLFDSHIWESSGRVSSQGMSNLLRFSCIQATVKNISIEPYEMQHVIERRNITKFSQYIS